MYGKGLGNRCLSARRVGLLLSPSILLGGLWAAERVGATGLRRRPPSAGRFPGRQRGEGRRRRGADPIRRRFQPQGRYPRLHAGQSVSGGHRHAAGRLSVSGPDRRDRPRPDQGVPLRPGHAGRLAHGHRPGQAGANRQGLRARIEQRSAGAAGARSDGRRSRSVSCAPSRSKTARRTAATAAPPAVDAGAKRRIRARWSSSIRAMAASTTARAPRAANWKSRSFSNSRCCCATRSKNPASTAWS